MPITRVGIVGGGTMGSSLAQLFAQSGFNVTVVEQSSSTLERCQRRIDTSLQKAVEKNVFSADKVASIKQRLRFYTELESLRTCDLIIEAIFENLAAKQELFARLATLVTPQALLATNTSSMRVAEMATPPQLRQRLFGLHYFYPPAQNRLLEIIAPPNVSPNDLAQIEAVAEATGRITLLCGDECGFVVNRFFVPWLNEACRILGDNLATLPQIDAVSREFAQAPFGAFEIMNLTGIPPCYHSMETFEQRFGRSYAPAPVLRAQFNSQLPWHLEHLENTDSIDKKTRHTIVQRLSDNLRSTCSALLKEGVCKTSDLDLGAAVGLKWGFAPSSLLEPRLFKPGPFTRARRREDKVGIIQLYRPQKMNALHPVTVQELQRHLDEFLRDPKISSIEIHGSGKAFCAGGDLTVHRQALANKRPEDFDRFIRTANNLFSFINSSPKPVTAVINGVAYGAGAMLALACHRIIAGPQARFAFPETGLGFIPALGGTQRLPKRVGSAWAKYLVATGTALGPLEAKQIGLCDEITAAAPLTPGLLSIHLLAVSLIASQTDNSWLSALHAGEFAAEFPEFTAAVQGRDLEALRVAMELIDLSEQLPIKAGLKRELTAIAQLFRRPEVGRRLKA